VYVILFFPLSFVETLESPPTFLFSLLFHKVNLFSFQQNVITDPPLFSFARFSSARKRKLSLFFPFFPGFEVNDFSSDKGGCYFLFARSLRETGIVEGPIFFFLLFHLLPQ